MCQKLYLKSDLYQIYSIWWALIPQFIFMHWEKKKEKKSSAHKTMHNFVPNKHHCVSCEALNQKFQTCSTAEKEGSREGSQVEYM